MHVRPMLQTEIPDASRLLSTLYWHDDVAPYVSPHRSLYPTSHLHRSIRAIKQAYYNGNTMLVCVLDDTDADWAGQETIVGFVSYATNIPTVQKPTPAGWLGNSFERWMVDLHVRYVRWFRLDPSVDVVAHGHVKMLNDEAVFDEYYRARAEGVRGEIRVGAEGKPFCWTVEGLGTNPGFRRRGVGRLLLQWGFERAREHDVPLVLMSTTIGRGLYLSTGFREVGTLKLSPDQLGEGWEQDKARERWAATDFGKGVGQGYERSAMVWEPRG